MASDSATIFIQNKPKQADIGCEQLRGNKSNFINPLGL